MKRNAVVLAVMGLMLWFAVRHASSVGVTPALAGSVTVFHGKAAPDFELKDLNGNTVRLSDYRGKAVALNFWATWCAPCKVEIPWLVDLQKQYRPRGLAVIGIAMETNGQAAVPQFVRDMQINYPILIGNNTVADAYGVGGLPTTFYIGRDGNIATRVYGLSSKSGMEENIKSALQERKERMATVPPSAPEPH